MPFWTHRERTPQLDRGLSWQLLALTVGATLLALAVGALALRFVAQRLVASAGESVALAAVDIAGKLDLLLVERYGDIQVLADSSVLHTGNSAVMTPLLEQFQAVYPVYLWLGVIDPNGRVLAATDPGSVGLDVSQASWFASVRTTGGIVVEDAAVTVEFNHTQAVTFAAPIRGPGGEWLGTVATHVSVPVLEDVFASTAMALQSQHGTASAIEYQFLTGDGTVIADSMLREEGRVNLKKRKLPSALLAESGPPGYVTETHSRRGSAVITGYAKTHGVLSWGILVRMSHDDILTPIRQFLGKLVLAGSAAWLPMVALLVWTGGRLQRISMQATRQAEQLTAIVTSIGDGVVTAARNGSITFMNPLAEYLTGWEQKEAVGLALSQVVRVVSEETKRAIENPIASVSREGGVVSLGTRLLLITRDGKEFSIEGHAAPIRDGQGALAGIVMAFCDGRVRRRTEKLQVAQLAVSVALAQSTTLAEAAPLFLKTICEMLGWDMGAIWLVEPDHQRIRCDAVWLAEAVPAQDFVAATCDCRFLSGIGLPGRVWASGKPAWLTDVAKEPNFPRAPIAVKAGLHASFAFPITIGDKVVGVIECFSREVRPFDPELLGMMTDVGLKIGLFLNRLRMAEKAKESDERFRLAIDHATDAIFFLDDRHVIRWVNRRAEAIIGRAENELVGRSLMEAFADQPMAGANLAAVDLNRSGLPLMEFEVVLKDGRALWLEVTSTAVRKGEAVVGGLLIMRDQTERKHTERMLRQSEKMASLGTLLDGIAHELNNPLFMITGHAQLAEEELRQGRAEGLAEELAAIQEASTRAVEIVRRTLAVTRSGERRQEACSVNDLVQRTLQVAAHDLAIQQIQVQTNLQADLPCVQADAHDVIQLLLLLITNARQAMATAHGKGVLTVTTTLATDGATQRPGDAEVAASGSRNGWIEIRVADDGPGIPPEYLARIFEPFFILKPAGGSAGLGLAICSRMVNELRGTLSVESEVGEGTTFIVRLPAMDASAQQAQRQTVEVSPPASSEEEDLRNTVPLHIQRGSALRRSDHGEQFTKDEGDRG